MKVFVILSLLFSFSAHAQVLGELQGDGQIQASYARFDGSKDNRTSPCHVAMNVDKSADSFALEFSFFECAKLAAWNDAPYSYKIVNGQLIDANGAAKGTVNNDGSLQFSEKTMSFHKYFEETYDFNCRLISSSPRTLVLNTVISYTFKQSADGSWQVRRQASEDRLAYTSRRSYPSCPAQTIPTKLGSTSDLSVVVK